MCTECNEFCVCENAVLPVRYPFTMHRENSISKRPDDFVDLYLTVQREGFAARRSTSHHLIHQRSATDEW